jgi:hypothetical protein
MNHDLLSDTRIVAHVRPSHPWISVIEYPLFQVSYPSEVTDEALTIMLEDLERIIFAMTAPYAWVVDLGRTLGATAKQRKMQAESELRLREHNRQHCAGVGLHVGNSVMRGVVTAVFWLSPPVYPYCITETLEEAQRWAREALRAHGVSRQQSR